MYQVLISRRTLRRIERLPEAVQDRLENLVEDLKKSGPVQPLWPNYSRLSPTEYHCHLSYRWVACWYHVKGTIRIEVYYVGSREDAPY
jgi:hypothetical protein